VQRRLEGLLAKLNGFVAEPETLRTFRAVEVLEHVGTPQARQVLQTLAIGQYADRVPGEAKSSLKRLAKRNPEPR
jgi:hypothetical protein